MKNWNLKKKLAELFRIMRNNRGSYRTIKAKQQYARNILRDLAIAQAAVYLYVRFFDGLCMIASESGRNGVLGRGLLEFGGYFFVGFQS